jgi:hypothetical protein
MVANDQSRDPARAGKLRADLQYGRIDEILATGLHAYLTQFLDRVNELGAHQPRLPRAWAWRAPAPARATGWSATAWLSDACRVAPQNTHLWRQLAQVHGAEADAAAGPVSSPRPCRRWPNCTSQLLQRRQFKLRAHRDKDSRRCCTTAFAWSMCTRPPGAAVRLLPRGASRVSPTSWKRTWIWPACCGDWKTTTARWRMRSARCEIAARAPVCRAHPGHGAAAPEPPGRSRGKHCAARCAASPALPMAERWTWRWLLLLAGQVGRRLAQYERRWSDTVRMARPRFYRPRWNGRGRSASRWRASASSCMPSRAWAM